MVVGGSSSPKKGCRLLSVGCGILSIFSGDGFGRKPVSTLLESTIFPLNDRDTENSNKRIRDSNEGNLIIYWKLWSFIDVNNLLIQL